MARETVRKELTPASVRNLTPPTDGRLYIFDTNPKCLCVRVTHTGAKSFVFAGKLKGVPLRITIGATDIWSLDDARREARRLQIQIDNGDDPRQVKAEKREAKESAAAARMAAATALEEKKTRESVTVAEAWAQYLANPPKKKGKIWGARHLADHIKLMLPERAKGDGDKTRILTAGVLASLAPLPLSALNAERIGKWLEDETPRRATQAALAFRLLRAFLNWCNERDEYKGIAAPDACANKVSKQHLPTAGAKNDALIKQELRQWFEAVRQIQNPTISTYLQGLLITGARRNELSGLRWEDCDFQRFSLTIRDKVDGERTIPMTPYFGKLLRDLKRRNTAAPTVRRMNALKEQGRAWEPSPWVFSSPTSATGKLQEPSIAHRKAIAAAGLPPVSLHGLRRSFGSLSEWCEVPVGIVAQIQGHKPSATAEKHYRVRPLDLLTMWHTKIEAWILEQAGIEFVPEKVGISLVQNIAA